MDHSPASPSTPTSEPDGTTVLGTPRPNHKRATAHIATPDLEHQPKKFRMDDQAHVDGLGNEALSVHRPWLDESEHGGKLHSQSAQASS